MTEPMSLERLAEKMRPLAGQVVLLYGTELVRFHGVAEDHMDLYYITESRRKRLSWNSAVGGITALKDRLGEDYVTLAEQFLRDGIIPRPFQVVRSVRFVKEWLEGRPADEPDVAARIRAAFERGLADCERDAFWRAQVASAKMVDDACDALSSRGLEELKVESFRKRVSGQHAEADPDGEAGLYAYPQGALRRRAEMLRRQAGAGVVHQCGVVIGEAGRFGVTLDMLSIMSGLDRKMPRPDLGQDLENDLRHICYEILGRAPDNDEEKDGPILRAMAEEVPFLSRFIGIWLGEHPDLTKIWSERGSIPIWLPAAAFCMANWKRYAQRPELLGLDEERARLVRSDMAIFGNGI